MQFFLSDFHILRPKFETHQSIGFEWIAAAHTQAEISSGKLSSADADNFKQLMIAKLQRVGCKPDVIFKRGHELSDFLHHNWDQMLVYPLNKNPQGVSLEARQKIHADLVQAKLQKFYENSSEEPRHLIHVTCTGYTSPSPGQHLLAEKGWTSTSITHMYHMGCYAAIPAIRLATSALNETPCDIIHTEICTLHNNPFLHDYEQLVAQSLFADGFIKYSLTTEPKENSFKILGIHEEIIPDTLNMMSWSLRDWGFQMTLAKEIPLIIAKGIDRFLENFSRKLKLKKEILTQAQFAIHPGGPQILKAVQKALYLNDEQLENSYEVLKNCGNMSSATLPHIWHSFGETNSLPSKTKVMSLAFGPGLTIAAIALEKV